MLLLSPDYALLWIAFAPLYLFPSSYEVWFPRHLRLLLLSCLLGQDTEEFNALVLPGSKSIIGRTPRDRWLRKDLEVQFFITDKSRRSIKEKSLVFIFDQLVISRHFEPSIMVKNLMMINDQLAANPLV
ncbi:hypothetical protein AFLA_004602 [Aspergillus flavus NRRL3357]|nr:hypothetical protein AFLA_004602 [Aspergillus flavus NRRL3357]